MDVYDADCAPHAEEWLALEEGERIALVQRFHRDAGTLLGKQQELVHAGIHAAVEVQLALKDEPIVRALSRLMTQGLSRHDALHAIGSAMIETMHDAMAATDEGPVLRARYYAAVERLSAESWREGG